jgi:hypothetical protein
MRKRRFPFKVVKAAQVQFEAWAKAFRRGSAQDTAIRFFAGDAIRPDYTEAGAAPLQFNSIDTSNLIDHVGSMNLLVAVAPLLSNGSYSSLYTEYLVQREGSQQDRINSMVCGHFPTMSTLMGLFPVEYWANSSPCSSVDDLLLDSSYGTVDENSQMKQMHIKLTLETNGRGYNITSARHPTQAAPGMSSGWLEYCIRCMLTCFGTRTSSFYSLISIHGLCQTTQCRASIEVALCSFCALCAVASRQIGRR